MSEDEYHPGEATYIQKLTKVQAVSRNGFICPLLCSDGKTVSGPVCRTKDAKCFGWETEAKDA